jgi:hypothetical protein
MLQLPETPEKAEESSLEVLAETFKDKLTVALALLAQRIHDRRDADFTIVTKQQRRFIALAIDRL